MRVHTLRVAASGLVVLAVLSVAGVAGAVPADPTTQVPGADEPAPPAAPGAPDDDPIPVGSQQAPDVSPAPRGPDVPSSSDLRAGARSRAGADEVVEIRHDGDHVAVGARVVALGGTVHGPAGDHALEARLPLGKVAALEADPHVSYVGPPTLSAPTAGDPGQAVTGAEVGFTNADDWHALGLRGSGVRVGIIDTFDGSTWSTAAASGDLPSSPSGTFCRVAGSSCNIWSGFEHGVAVAEIVREMAPQTQLYLASVRTTADFQAAIDYFASQGVTVVTRSETAEYDGAGNGTGPNAEVVNRAVAKGMVYLNAAGNSAGSGSQRGSYWRGSWSDPDGDGWLNFAGADELMGMSCRYVNGLRWSDWGGNRTDYDLFIYDTAGNLVVSGQDAQGTGAPPLERVVDRLGCSLGQPLQAAIRLYSAGSGTAGDKLELMTNGGGLEYWSNPYSAAAPMADSANPGALAVGAIDPAAGVTIAPYSSQGPTNDGRMKPDLSAVSCVASTSYAPSCFNGTSAATPVVAGAAALVRGIGVATGPAGVADFLRGAAVERGIPGPDNVYGHGELVLPSPRSAYPFSSWAAMVDRQYRDIVGRPPTSTERSTWVGRLAVGGYPPSWLISGLRESADNTSNVDPAARLYQAYFLRAPDAPGLQYWIARRRAGWSLNRISEFFAGSPEFKTRYGTLSNAAFVDLIYRNILGRPGEASGVAFWNSELNSGRRNRGTVMVGFSESPEYKAKQQRSVNASVLMILMLRRAPTTAERTLLTAGSATHIAIAEWIYARTEYVDLVR